MFREISAISCIPATFVGEVSNKNHIGDLDEIRVLYSPRSPNLARVHDLIRLIGSDRGGSRLSAVVSEIDRLNLADYFRRR